MIVYKVFYVIKFIVPKLQKIKTESPATALGVLSFSLETGAPKLSPQQVFLIVGAIIAIEILLFLFYPL